MSSLQFQLSQKLLSDGGYFPTINLIHYRNGDREPINPSSSNENTNDAYNFYDIFANQQFDFNL
ncbi:5527_t:CDS:2 [Entrophospora sp. SA101]|nr:5527_t:CDS:2 [Entrophospora sp. SA101]